MESGNENKFNEQNVKEKMIGMYGTGSVMPQSCMLSPLFFQHLDICHGPT